MRATIRQFPLAGVISRDVTNEDIPRILQTMVIMFTLLVKANGIALAHCQVVDKDPLRFYVHRSGSVMINPIITRHTRDTVQKDEGCLSYCTKKPIKIERYHKIEVSYQTIANDKLSEPEILSLTGEDSQAVQHEIEHFDGFNIYGEI